MKRLVLNGSPRGRKSNSRTIISWMLEGFKEAGAEEPPILDLARTKELEDQHRAFLEADEVLLVFPLYTDSVPGIVMGFINSLAAAAPDRLRGKRLAFVVHSGFPESMQSEPVVRYLVRLCQRLGITCAGTAIKAGSEGYRLMPVSMVKKTMARFIALGRGLASEGLFPNRIVQKLARPRLLSPFVIAVLFLLKPTGLVNLYWKMMLKKHNAWGRRFDRPYAAADTGVVSG
jgi:multimeric flavodoxin WrbA